MILVLDNYDSFTYNLVQHLGALGSEPRVVRNDEASVEQLRDLDPDRVVISPGPCSPAEAGVSVEAVRVLGARDRRPLLGVCLGHQAIGEAFGGRTVRARRLMHGKTAPVRHDGAGIFRGIPSPFSVTRYHSLVTDPERLPRELVPVAWSTGPEEEDEVQGMRHRELPIWGVQFHPESHFSEYGLDLLRNFLSL